MLRSRLFHSDECRTKRVKSPVALAIGAIRGGEAFAPPPDLVELEIHLTRMGQRLFYPPNVAGWPGGLAWLRGSTLLARASFAAWLTDPSSGLSPIPFPRPRPSGIGWRTPRPGSTPWPCCSLARRSPRIAKTSCSPVFAPSPIPHACTGGF